MPYSIVKRGKQWCVITKATGKSHGCHPSKAEAAKQLVAIRINTKE